LIARQGAERRHHFAHCVESRCDGGLETVLHYLGKELIARLDWIALPAYRFTATAKGAAGSTVTIDRPVLPPLRVRISRAATERPLAGFRPDVVLECGDRILWVEVCVTHAVDRTKRRKVRRAGGAMIEVHLRPEDALRSPAELMALLREDTARKRWVYSPLQRASEAEWIRLRRDALREHRRRRQSPDSSPEPDAPTGKPWIRTDADFVAWARRARYGRRGS
jgi:hypothetical protein